MQFLKRRNTLHLEFEYIFRYTSYFNFDGTAKYVKHRLQRGTNAVHSIKEQIKINICKWGGP
jgi:hypothetical protein